jgi:hypothetical protein
LAGSLAFFSLALTRIFPRMFVILSIANVVANFIVLIGMAACTNSSVTPEDSRDSIRATMQAVIWEPYMLISKRVYAFDLLADDGVDMRDQPLQIRKLWLGKLLKRSGDGILLNEHEAGEIGPRLFEQACKMGLEGIVSKHREKTYRAGRCAFWIKVKNPKSPAMLRAEEGSW